MGFWKKLFGLEKKTKAKFDAFAVDMDGDGKVQDGTIWERPAALTVDLDATLAKAEQLLKEVAPDKDLKVSADLEKKRKKQSAIKKAATTKKANTTTKKTTAKPKSAPKKADPKKAQPKATKKK